jgi:hypothetical protein
MRERNVRAIGVYAAYIFGACPGFDGGDVVTGRAARHRVRDAQLVSPHTDGIQAAL